MRNVKNGGVYACVGGQGAYGNSVTFIHVFIIHTLLATECVCVCDVDYISSFYKSTIGFTIFIYLNFLICRVKLKTASTLGDCGAE